MDNPENDVVDEQVADAPATDAPEETSAPAEAPWSPSKDEWQATQQAIQKMAAYLEPEPTPSYDETNPYEVMQNYMDQRFAQYEPSIQAAANVAGEKRLNEIFDTVQKSEKIDFDRELARRAAESFMATEGDPVKATVEGAKYAAQVRKQERTSAVEEYKKSLARPGSTDFGAESAGEHVPADADTYEEVMARWGSQTEV